jgi:hypothetical protein
MALHFRALACLVAMGGALTFGLAACSSSTAADSGGDGATPNPNGKVDGAECTVGFDCKSGLCTSGTCTASTLSSSDQTDVGCGGTSAPACGDGKKCKVAGDCTSGVCTGGTCAAPSPTDGVKNGDETDVDCGGATAPKCGVGKACAAHADCASDACSYEKKCVGAKGCTGHFGGDTCGEGETGDPGAKHESCCTTVDVTDRPAGSFTVDKYQVTAGRMRAFVERYDGNLQAWAATNPKAWNQAWNDKLPATKADALYLLGPGGKRGCNVTNEGGRTYWQGPIDGNTAEQSDFTQDVLDEKALNCVTWYMAQAVCAFDGGRLPTNAEVKWLYENGGQTQYPWQVNDPGSYNANAADMHVIHQYSYATPNPPAAMRLVGTGSGAYPLDHAFWMAPPGRRPTGADKYGVMDVAGNMLEWINDTPKYFTWTMSWEKHAKNLTPTQWNMSDGPDGYYAIGARCVYQ